MDCSAVFLRENLFRIRPKIERFGSCTLPDEFPGERFGFCSTLDEPPRFSNVLTALAKVRECWEIWLTEMLSFSMLAVSGGNISFFNFFHELL